MRKTLRAVDAGLLLRRATAPTTPPTHRYEAESQPLMAAGSKIGTTMFRIAYVWLNVKVASMISLPEYVTCHEISNKHFVNVIQRKLKTHQTSLQHIIDHLTSVNAPTLYRHLLSKYHVAMQFLNVFYPIESTVDLNVGSVHVDGSSRYLRQCRDLNVPSPGHEPIRYL